MDSFNANTATSNVFDMFYIESVDIFQNSYPYLAVQRELSKSARLWYQDTSLYLSTTFLHDHIQ